MRSKSEKKKLMIQIYKRLFVRWMICIVTMLVIVLLLNYMAIFMNMVTFVNLDKFNLIHNVTCDSKNYQVFYRSLISVPINKTMIVYIDGTMLGEISHGGIAIIIGNHGAIKIRDRFYFMLLLFVTAILVFFYNFYLMYQHAKEADKQIRKIKEGVRA